MLSRTADNLYWTGRYMERAENMARILDVSQRISLLPAQSRDSASEWLAILGILGQAEAYAERYGEVTGDQVITFLTLDPENPSSIRACVQAARENARALRAALSNEMWESLNTTWLELRGLDPATLHKRGAREFFDWVKERSHLFRGVTYGTMLHNSAFHFIRLGTFLERGDNTARILDTKYHLLQPGAEEAESAASFYEWGAVLRAVSAFRAYHQVYSDVISPVRVAELLVLRPDMPRSLRFCYDQVMAVLDQLSNQRELECGRLAGEFQARLRYSRIERIIKDGLHDFLVESIGRVAEVSAQMQRDFLMTV